MKAFCTTPKVAIANNTRILDCFMKSLKLTSVFKATFPHIMITFASVDSDPNQ